MKPKFVLSLAAVGVLFACGGYWQIRKHLNEPMFYPPEIAGKRYLTFSYGPEDHFSEYLNVGVDPERSRIQVKFKNGAPTEYYDFDLKLVDHETPTNQAWDDIPLEFPDSGTILPGRYTFAADFLGDTGSMAYGGSIADAPWFKNYGAFSGDWIHQRYVLHYSLSYKTDPPKVIGMKDWSIQFEGQWRTERLTRFTGTWALAVHDRPVFRQKVKNVPIGTDFYYSPVYGLVLLETHGDTSNRTLYVIKVAASGPAVYDDLKGNEIVYGLMPEHQPLQR